MIVGPLQLVYEIQTAVYDEWVHVACFLTEAGDAIAALLGGAEFELEYRLVSRADYTEIVGHVARLRKGTGEGDADSKLSGLMP